jgi:hypothetical protein
MPQAVNQAVELTVDSHKVDHRSVLALSRPANTSLPST